MDNQEGAHIRKVTTEGMVLRVRGILTKNVAREWAQ